jgi:hypothetical protein
MVLYLGCLAVMVTKKYKMGERTETLNIFAVEKKQYYKLRSNKFFAKEIWFNI